jgi:hypothetical protein
MCNEWAYYINSPIRLYLNSVTFNLFNIVILIIDFTYVIILMLVNFTSCSCWQTFKILRWLEDGN